MRLTADKTALVYLVYLVYNDWLTLTGIPPRVFDYRLGNRAALEWVIDQYHVSTDPRSQVISDPNDLAHPQAIFTLIKQVIAVSLHFAVCHTGILERSHKLLTYST